MLNFSYKQMLQKGLKYLIIFILPFLVDKFIVEFPQIAQLTIGALLVMGVNYLKNAAGLRIIQRIFTKIKNWIAGGLLIFLSFEIIILSLIVRREKEVNALNSVSITHISRKIELPAVLLRIAKCESGDRQFWNDGTLVRGKVNPKDVGRFQISETYWLEKSKELNLDIYTEKGNTLMALWIYQNYGSGPWFWSHHCWN